MFIKLRISNISKKWANSRNNALLSLIESNPNAKIVDLGCGNGELTLDIKRKSGCNEILGVDINQSAEEKGILIKKLDLNENLPFEDNFFDVVVSNQVIEHLFYPVRFLKEIRRILKPGGYAVISTENLASWDNIFALILGYTPFSMEFDEELAKIGNPLSPSEKIIKNYLFPHIRILTWNGLIELSKHLKLKIEQSDGAGHIFFKVGEMINKKNCRYIVIKVRK